MKIMNAISKDSAKMHIERQHQYKIVGEVEFRIILVEVRN